MCGIGWTVQGCGFLQFKGGVQRLRKGNPGRGRRGLDAVGGGLEGNPAEIRQLTSSFFFLIIYLLFCSAIHIIPSFCHNVLFSMQESGKRQRSFLIGHWWVLNNQWKKRTIILNTDCGIISVVIKLINLAVPHSANPLTKVFLLWLNIYHLTS